jgi:hypothetical protein
MLLAVETFLCLEKIVRFLLLNSPVTPIGTGVPFGSLILNFSVLHILAKEISEQTR